MCVLFDGTVVSPGFGMLYGLDDVPVVIGGVSPFGEGRDMAAQKLEGENIADTDPRFMATESMSFVIKPIDTDQITMDSCMVPYRPKGLTKEIMFSMLGFYLKQATIANRGLPPLCCSHDGHGVQGCDIP